MATKKYNIDFSPLNIVEKKILSEIPETLLDKLLTIRDLESIAFLSKNSMTEEERVMMVARRKAFDEFIQTIKSLKNEERRANEQEKRKSQASKILV